MSLFRRGAAALAIIAGLAAPAAAQPVPGPNAPQCQRDLFFAEGTMRASRYKLNDAASGDQAARCAAWRGHEDAMRKAGAIFRRCLNGAERTEKVALTEREAQDMASAIRTQCAAGRPAPVERLRPQG